jgi:hypothetical protein
MINLRANGITLLLMFILNLVLLGAARGPFGLTFLDNTAIYILAALILAPATFLALKFILSAPTPRFLVLRLWIVIVILGLILRTIYQLQANNFLTAMGFITLLDGPIVTLVGVLGAVAILNTRIQKAFLAGAGAALATGILVVILRALQHIEPAWEPGVVIPLAVVGGLGGFIMGLNLIDPRTLFAGEAGLPRAIALGILGFLVGGLFVVVLRGLQSLDPLWDTGSGIVMTAFTTAGFFLWGMGAFDPKMSEHGGGEEHTEEIALAVHAEAAEKDTQATILGTYIWQITLLVLVILVVIAVFALAPGGPLIRTTGDPTGDVAAVGTMSVQLPFDGPIIQVSELVFFIGFIIFTILSLAAAAGIIALLMYFLSRNVQQVKNSQPTPEELAPPAPVQGLSRAAASVAEWLRRDLPKLLGQK